MTYEPVPTFSSDDDALRLDPASMEAAYVKTATLARLDGYASTRLALPSTIHREPSNPGAPLSHLAPEREDLTSALYDYPATFTRTPGVFSYEALVRAAAALAAGRYQRLWA